MEVFAYDQVQYQSHPYRQSHPERLYTLAKVFGLAPIHYSKARILELGCASGGNIIPVAYNYPQAQVVGLDLSAKQIEEGRQFIEKLKLSNIELLSISILDVQPSLGVFDYIICHGIYSWVPAEVRDKILGICKDHLAPQGIAYISYNTYPGWNVVHSIRDMMLFHTKALETPQEKASQSRNLLQFLSNGLAEEKTAYGDFLSHEIDLLKKQPDSYLLHDHLEEVNFPIYFHDFIAHANQHSLDYLSDAKLSSMFLGNLPEKAAQALSGITHIVKSNQYMDFIRNQRFRSTLLCLNTVKIQRQLKTNQIEAFYLSYVGGYSQTEITQESILSDGVGLFFAGAGITLTVKHPISKVAMTLLQTHNIIPILYSDFIEAVKLKLEAYGMVYTLDFIKTHIQKDLNLMRLVFGGIIDLSCDPVLYVAHCSDTPQTTDLIKEQVKLSDIVTNQRHEIIKVSDFEKAVLLLLDGKKTQKKIVDFLCEQEMESVNKPENNVQSEKNKNIINKELRAKINTLYMAACQKFAQYALLIK